MLVVERGCLRDDWIRSFPNRLMSGSLLVLNDTRVRRARVIGTRRDSGGRVEFLLIGCESRDPGGKGREIWSALGRPLRRLRDGVRVDLEGMSIRVVERRADDLLCIEVEASDGLDVESALERYGHVPIPPYLGRDDEPSDVDRYQTVFAQRQGSVAAPTAGLHLTQSTIAAIKNRGVEVGEVTLHVGIGTFRPVAVDDLDDHCMHSEWFEVGDKLVEQVRATRKRGGSVIAIGTTVVRAMESAADPEQSGLVQRTSGETRLLIQPGYRFRVVDGLLTNFHQPRSTLLALVAAAIGVEGVRAAYRWALARSYRFLSYGDAMWIPEFQR